MRLYWCRLVLPQVQISASASAACYDDPAEFGQFLEHVRGIPVENTVHGFLHSS